MTQYIFYFLAFLSIASALMVVFTKNPIHSVLYLVVCFFSIAGHYLLLNAQFLAIVHIIVYAGAIMVLFLFLIMLLNLNKENDFQKTNLIKFAAVISSGIFMVVMIATLKNVDIAMSSIPSSPETGYVQNIGMILFTDYLLPFEVSSILFLSAMIGVVLISKKEKIDSNV